MTADSIEPQVSVAHANEPCEPVNGEAISPPPHTETCGWPGEAIEAVAKEYDHLATIHSNPDLIFIYRDVAKRLRSSLPRPPSGSGWRDIETSDPIAAVEAALKNQDEELFKLVGSEKIAASRVFAAIAKAGYTVWPAPPEAAVSSDGMVLVPESAIKWLMGEGPDPDGKWFGEHDDDGTRPLAGNFWWRSRFRKQIEAADHSTLNSTAKP